MTEEPSPPMRTSLLSLTRIAVPISALVVACVSAPAQPQPRLSIQTNGAQIELNWPARLTLPAGTPVFPLYEVQRSLDLRAWHAATAKLKGGAATNLTAAFDRDQAAAFYRLLAEWTNSLTGDGGANVFGYGRAFAEELQRIGQITLGQFAARYAITNVYLSVFPHEPTNALYWDLFNVDPLAHDVCVMPVLNPFVNFNFRHYD